MAKLDSNAAWKEAASLVATNRDVFFALAGVFFLLPSLAFAIFVGEPQMTPGMEREQMMAALTAFYADAWWLIVIGTLLQVVGILAILTLMRDRSRPTVGQAIKGGFLGLLPYLAAQLSFVVAVGLIGGILIALAALAGPALAAIVTIVVFGFAIYASFRLILLAPIVAVEGLRNPVAAMRRSWALTRGNFWRIFGFLVLAAILFIVVLSVIMLVVGLILAIVSSGETQRILAAVVSSALTAIAVLYFIGIMAAIHRQLAGSGKESLGETSA
jgi:hypothetical protein